MKSSYKLIGAFWDGKPEAGDAECAVSYDSSYLSWHSKDSLFDYIEKKRSVKLSELFSIDTQGQFASLLRGLQGCDSVAVVVDYFPRVSSSVHLSFYRHRVSQVLQALREALPSCSVVMMGSSGKEVAA